MLVYACVNGPSIYSYFINDPSVAASIERKYLYENWPG